MRGEHPGILWLPNNSRANLEEATPHRRSGVRPASARETLASVTDGHPTCAGTSAWRAPRAGADRQPVPPQHGCNPEEWPGVSYDDQTEERNEPERTAVREMYMTVSQLSERGGVQLGLETYSLFPLLPGAQQGALMWRKGLQRTPHAWLCDLGCTVYLL